MASNSGLEMFQTCPELYRLAKIIGVPVPGPVAPELMFGSAFHEARELYHNEFGFDAGTAAIRAYAAKHGMDPYERVRCEVTFAAWVAWWEQEKPLHFVAVEEPGQLYHAGHRTRFILDGIIYDEGDLVYELKTTSKLIDLAGPYFLRLNFDQQIGIYLHAARRLGYKNVKGILYDVVVKPAVTPKRATPMAKRKYRKSDGKLHANQRDEDETLGEFRQRCVEWFIKNCDRAFARVRVVRLKHEEEAALRNVRRWHEMLNVLGPGDEIWPRSTKNCTKYGRLCDYFEYCAGHRDWREHVTKKPRQGETGNTAPGLRLWD